MYIYIYIYFFGIYLVIYIILYLPEVDHGQPRGREVLDPHRLVVAVPMCVYICVCIYIYIYIYTYVYTYRERDVYIIYIYIYIERERDATRSTPCGAAPQRAPTRRNSIRKHKPRTNQPIKHSIRRNNRQNNTK